MSQGQILLGLPDNGELLIFTQDQPLTIVPSLDRRFYVASQHALILAMTTPATLGYPSLNPGGNMGVVSDNDAIVAGTLLESVGSRHTPLDATNAEDAIHLPSTGGHNGALSLRFIVPPAPGINGVVIYAASPCPKLVVGSCGEVRVEPSGLWRRQRVRFEDDRTTP